MAALENGSLLGALPQKDLGHDLGPRRQPLTWEEILALDKDHEKHLETAEGRFHAALNIIKTGAMVLELWALREEAYLNYKDVNTKASEVYGQRLCESRVTFNHLVKTVSTVGAAARSDLSDQEWRRTAYGSALLPAAIYSWQAILRLGINPANALASKSAVKLDEEGNLADSAPYARAMMLLDIRELGETTEAELAKRRKLSHKVIHQHLQYLKAEGLVKFESADPVDSFSYFRATDLGKTSAKWPVLIDLQGGNQRKLSSDVELAIVGLAIEGRETFTMSDIISWTEANNPDAGQSIKHFRAVSVALSYFVNYGLLERGQFGKGNMSDISLFPKGTAFCEQVLAPLALWSEDPGAVAEIDTIRQELHINPDSYNSIFKDIATVYSDTSPYKNSDKDGKTTGILNLILRSQGKMTTADIARELGISDTQVYEILKPLIDSGVVTVEVGKMGRKYLSAPEKM